MDGTRERLRRRALLLAYATIGYNVLEAAVAIAAGGAAGSPALLSFGGDSLIESLSALVIVWQFTGDGDTREARARRLIGVAFVVLAGSVIVGSGAALLQGSQPEASPVGIALALVSLVVMPALVVAKRRTASALGSTTVRADSVQSLLCAGLSAALLVGLVANAALGWWWADPIAAVAIAAVAAREGLGLLRGRTDDCC